MKRHPLGLMIAIVLLQTACSSQQEHTSSLHHQAASVITPSTVYVPETLVDKKDNTASPYALEEKESHDSLSAAASSRIDASFAKSRVHAKKPYLIKR